MQRRPVSSSNVASIGYDPSTEILEVEFRDGSVYQYYGVPLFAYEGLIAAVSHGSFLNTNIKGQYRCEKL